MHCAARIVGVIVCDHRCAVDYIICHHLVRYHCSHRHCHCIVTAAATALHHAACNPVQLLHIIEKPVRKLTLWIVSLIYNSLNIPEIILIKCKIFYCHWEDIDVNESFLVIHFWTNLLVLTMTITYLYPLQCGMWERARRQQFDNNWEHCTKTHNSNDILSSQNKVFKCMILNNIYSTCTHLN